jgi:hypothetical protein
MRAGRRDLRAVLGTAAIAITSLLVAAPAANAAFGLNGLAATPASTQAGANTNFTIHLGITEPAHDLKDLTIHLPPGLVGNPLATTMCTEAQLNADSCPASSQVGTVSNDVLVSVGIVDLPQTVSGKIYNLVPRSGEPARFGIVLSALPLPPPLNGYILPAIILQSPASLRQSDFGLDTVLNNLPRQAEVAPGVTADITITAVTLTLNGMVGSPPTGFIRLPTSCGTHTVGFDATAYDNQTATGQATFTTVNCAALPFTPELSAKLKLHKTGQAVDLSTNVAQTIDEAGIRNATVILPKDLSGDTSVFASTCPDASFQAGTCPESSIVGSAVASSPLQSQSLSGPVVLVTAAGFPDLGLDLRGPLALKLKGKVGLSQDVRNMVSFIDLPDIPLSAFTLTFDGGPGGLVLAAPDACKHSPLTFDGSFLSQAGTTATVASRAEVQGCGPGGGARKPKAKVKLGRLGTDEPRMRFSVKAGAEKLRSAKLKLPKQLRFASGKAFDEGSSFAKASVKSSKGGLTIKARKPAKRLRGKIANGALVPGHGLKPGKRLKFKFSVRDRAGKTTKLTVRAK